jgi:hypothetical protein
MPSPIVPTASVARPPTVLRGPTKRTCDAVNHPSRAASSPSITLRTAIVIAFTAFTVRRTEPHFPPPGTALAARVVAIGAVPR